jgi:PAS domain S-box-containing protein
MVSTEKRFSGAVQDSRPSQSRPILSHNAISLQGVASATVDRPNQTPLAPTPVASHPPMVAAQGISVPALASSFLQTATHIAPAPSHTAGLNGDATSQLNTIATKRRRMDSGTPTTDGRLAVESLTVASALQGRGRKKTQAQIDRRRERNRILARRTRLRKKFFFESLQKEVVDLQRENAALKDIVRTQLADGGQKLLEECDAMERLPEAVFEACGENANDYDQQDFNLVRSIQQSQHSFIITDPSLHDNPIVFASDDFLSLTGYEREDVLGRNCRFLQGTDTSQEKVAQIRKGLANGEDVSVTLVNYSANGTPFWNKLFIAALRDGQNNIVNYIGVTVKIATPEDGDSEAGKQLPGGQDPETVASSVDINYDTDDATNEATSDE